MAGSAGGNGESHPGDSRQFISASPVQAGLIKFMLLYRKGERAGEKEETY